MTTTLIAILKITNKDNLARYRENAATALQKHGGSVSAAGMISATLEGTPIDADTAAVLSFPSAQAAQNWIEDPELASIHALRNSGGASTIFMLG